MVGLKLKSKLNPLRNITGIECRGKLGRDTSLPEVDGRLELDQAVLKIATGV
jgi:hypothetical protein